ncbi:hypothetical protein MNV49_006249 [Pseudohyphozyma bogoriensis]|nr:hypothetical protein MNV49_006249 [Pseudohyphozyma bogoriensis]
MEDDLVMPASKLVPLRGGQDGFFVEGDGAVSWSTLIGFLLDPTSTQLLSDRHLAKRLANFLRAETLPPQEPPTESVPPSYYSGPPPAVHYYTTAPTQQLLHLSSHNTTPTLSIHQPSPTRPTFAVGSTYFPPSSQGPSPQRFGATSPATSLADSLEFDGSPYGLDPLSLYNAPDPPGQQRGLSRERMPSHHRQDLRPHPYPPPSRPASIHSVHSVRSNHSVSPSLHSVHSLASNYSSHSAQSSISGRESSVESPPGEQKPRVLRALNRETEHYVWSGTRAQLYRVAPGTDIASFAAVEQDSEGSEVISFPPGSYYKVFKEDLELLPSDGKSVNEWLRGQECVGDCRFHFERKRPATIRAHFIQCKFRAAELSVDPIRRLCQLQQEAGRQFRAAPFSNQSGAYGSFDVPQESEYTSTTSPSTNSVHSSNSYDVKVLRDEPDSYALGGLSEMLTSAESDYGPWLGSYGLDRCLSSDPLHVSNGVPVPYELTSSSQSHPQSFLSMDEE